MKPLPNSYLQALGQIVDAMSSAENGLIYTISSITGNDIDTTLCLVGGESFDILISKVNKLVHCRLKDKALLGKFDTLRKQLSNFNDERNHYIHALWLPDSKKVMRVKYKKQSKDGSLVQVEEHVEPEAIISLAQNIRKSVNSLMELIAENMKLPSDSAT